ncbi:MAG: ABC transporter permease [Terracidiphilus sp.]|jgi:predicted permease
MQAIIQDIRYALRQLRKSPGFAFTVVLTLALSVGVATAVFCVIDNVILRPLPYAHPEKIVFIQATARAGYNQPASWPSYQDERAQLRTFSAFAGYNDFKKITLDAPASGPTAIDCVRSTDNFFQVFGVQPLMGRTFLPSEEQDGKNEIVVLSYDAWQSYFNGDGSVLGKPVKLDGRAFTIIGVMPSGFRYPLNMHNGVYIPHLIDEDWMSRRGAHWLRTVGRIKDGVTLQQAQADLTHVFNDIGKAYPDTDGGRIVQPVPLAENVNSKSKGPLWTLLGAVLAVLAIGCVNVAGLLLARGVKREREMAMRVAIGAGRVRLIRQVLTEGILMALAGAAGGVLLASVLLDLMRAFLIKALARGVDIHLNWIVLAAAIAVAVLSSLAASLYPAMRLSGIDPNRALKSGGSAGTQRGQYRLRYSFVVTQVALTLVLLVVSGLLMRVVTRYRHADLGFDPAHILSVKIGLSPARYQGRDMITAFYAPLEERVRHLPGVQAAGLISVLPIESWGVNADAHIGGQPPYPPHQEMLTETRFISEGYLDAMGIPLHRGRRLSRSLDRAENIASTVLVNDAFVSKFIPSRLDPTAQRIDDSPKQEEWDRIVGVTGNIRQSIYDPPMAEVDWLINELPLKEQADILANMTLLVHTSGDPEQLIPSVRSAIHELDQTVPFDAPRTMTEVVSEVLVFERMESWLFGIFAGLALALAMVGLYGLVSHEVEQTTRDIGVRMALGATRPGILAMVLRRVASMLGAGTIVGFALTLAARKLIGVVIYFDAQKEAGGFLFVALLLVVAGLAAAVVPAARAASIEPMQALRTE